MSSGDLTLHEAAELLGVHYMTAYRYVRLGLLPAVKASVVLTAAREPALARRFLAFLTGEQGRAILARSGYGLP